MNLSIVASRPFPYYCWQQYSQLQALALTAENLVQLQERFWVMSCSAALEEELSERSHDVFVDAH
jgi:hypothetical protein